MIEPTKISQMAPAIRVVEAAPASKPAKRNEREKESAQTLDPKQAAKLVDQYLQRASSNLIFQIDESTGIQFFQVINPTTKEVIRQVPPEEAIRMAQRLQELDPSGVVFNQEG